VLGKKSPWDVTTIKVMEEAALAEDVGGRQFNKLQNKKSPQIKFYPHGS